MLLVDTSVWIDFFSGRKLPHVEYLKVGIQTGIDTATTSVVYQEVLQGCKTEREFQRYQAYFSTLKFAHPADPISSYEAAAKLYFDCRRQGLTIRSTTDCLLAQIAIENDLILLHNDRDFIDISQTNKNLKQTDGNK